jgi:hypothetical protein
MPKKIELFKTFTSDQTLHDTLKNLRSEIQQVEAVSGYKAVDHYERSIGRITNISLRIDDFLDSVTVLKTALMTQLLKEKGTPKPG